MSPVKGNKARYDSFVQQAIALANAPQDLTSGPPGALAITVGDVDLPAFVANGKLYIQAPLPHIFRAFAEDLSEFLSDLEIGISVTRSAALSLASTRGAVRRAGVAKPHVVQGSGEQ